MFCLVCKSVFSIKNCGKADIKQHITKAKKHLSAVSSMSSNDKVTSFFFNKAQLVYLMKVRVSQQKRGYFNFIQSYIIIPLDQWTAHQPF